MSRARKSAGSSERKLTRGSKAGAAPASGGGKGLLDRLKPDTIAKIEHELADRLSKVPNRMNEYDYDPWGLSLAVLKRTLVPTVLFYRYWFRAQTRGIENLPRGRVLLIGNHAGQIAIDAAMLGAAVLLEGNPPRIARGMGEFWLPRLPWFSTFLHRVGGVVGTPKNCVDLLRNEEAVTVFPEGVRGVNKLYKERYQLKRFGLGFMRLALQTNTPIVPVAFVGSEEQAIAIADIKPLARLLGTPAFPITLTWPLLGPLGLMPLPSRYYIEFGEPMHFRGNHDDEDRVIEAKVEKVKARIARMLDAGRRRRKSIYF